MSPDLENMPGGHILVLEIIMWLYELIVGWIYMLKPFVVIFWIWKSPMWLYEQVLNEQVDCMKMKDETMTTTFQIMQTEFDDTKKQNKVVVSFGF